MLGGTDADPVEIGFMLQVLQAIEHFAHVVSGAMARQHQKFLQALFRITTVELLWGNLHMVKEPFNS